MNQNTKLVELRDYLIHRRDVTLPEVVNNPDEYPFAMRMAYEGKIDEVRWIIEQLNSIIGDKERK